MERYEIAVKNQPYVADAHYDCAVEYENCGRLFEAYEQYSIAIELMAGENPYSFDEMKITEKSEALLDRIAESISGRENADELRIKKKWIDYIVCQSDIRWGIPYDAFFVKTEVITKEYMDYVYLPKMYVGYAAQIKNDAALMAEGEKASKTCSTYKAELQRIFFKGTNVTIESDCEYFLPMIADTQMTLDMEVEGESHTMPYASPWRYIHFRMPAGKCTLRSDEPFRLGEKIPIRHSGERKKLILNIFVDGLSQMVLREDFEGLMPYTYRYFKKGLICNHVHSEGDWTFPSIASIVTGQTMANHKMLHSKLRRKIDLDTPMLFEYFKEAGYNTSKIGGNWRITPCYGYARGMNRVLFQNHYLGYPAESIVSDVIEQIHGMRDTDQFIWMEIGELHQVADNLGLADLVQEFSVEESRETTKGFNSVKQSYDPMKIQYYKKQIERVDRKLAALYQYMEDHYTDDEIIVTLFSDHGQSYLIKPEEEFLSEGRSSVAFMVRGSGVTGQTDEVISTCDYTPIVCKLAGLAYSYDNTDAHLPLAFGGDGEREFAVVETIHVGDPYEIALKGKDFTFYLKGKENVTSECRVPLGEYTVKLLDREEKNTIEDQERIACYTQYCLDHISSCVIRE